MEQSIEQVVLMGKNRWDALLFDLWVALDKYEVEAEYVVVGSGEDKTLQRRMSDLVGSYNMIVDQAGLDVQMFQFYRLNDEQLTIDNQYINETELVTEGFEDYGITVRREVMESWLSYMVEGDERLLRMGYTVIILSVDDIKYLIENMNENNPEEDG